MSDLYPYFTPQEIQFRGEVPPPDPVGTDNVGRSKIKANSDHSHPISFGGQNNPWNPVLFGAGWFQWAAGTRLCEYCSIGQIGILRGVFGAPAGAANGSIMGTIGSQFAPISARETFPAITFVGAAEIDIAPNGQIIYQFGPTNPSWVLFGTLMWSID